MHFQKKKSGFTLIESLVSITVFGLLLVSVISILLSQITSQAVILGTESLFSDTAQLKKYLLDEGFRYSFYSVDHLKRGANETGSDMENTMRSNLRDVLTKYGVFLDSYRYCLNMSSIYGGDGTGKEDYAKYYEPHFWGKIQNRLGDSLCRNGQNSSGNEKILVGVNLSAYRYVIYFRNESRLIKLSGQLNTDPSVDTILDQRNISVERLDKFYTTYFSGTTQNVCINPSAGECLFFDYKKQPNEYGELLVKAVRPTKKGGYLNMATTVYEDFLVPLNP